MMNAFKTAAGSIVLPKGRMMYPNFFTPGPLGKGETDPKRFGWQITHLMPAGVDLSVLDAAILEIFEENLIKKQRDGSPLSIKNGRLLGTKDIKVDPVFVGTADQAKLANLADDLPFLRKAKARARRLRTSR